MNKYVAIITEFDLAEGKPCITRNTELFLCESDELAKSYAEAAMQDYANDVDDIDVLGEGYVKMSPTAELDVLVVPLSVWASGEYSPVVTGDREYDYLTA